jgi:hypothetical protein
VFICNIAKSPLIAGILLFYHIPLPKTQPVIIPANLHTDFTSSLVFCPVCPTFAPQKMTETGVNMSLNPVIQTPKS